MAIHIADAYVDVEARDQTQADVDRIMQRLRSLGPAAIGLKIDDQTQADLDRIERRIRNLGPADIGIRIDDQTQAQAAAIMARLNSLGPAQIGIELNLNTATVRGQLARLQRTLHIPVEVNDQTFAGLSAVFAEFERFRLLSSRLLNIPVTAHDNLDVGLGQAYAEMLMFRQLAERVLRIPVTTSGGLNFPNLGGAAGSAGQMSKNLYLVAAAIAALPALSVAAGGAITLGIGGAISALPVLAWASSAKVKEAYSGLWGEIKSGLREVSPEWEGHIAGWAQTIRDLGTNWSNTLEGVFTNVGPALTGFWDDMRLGLNALRPTFQAAGDAFATLLAALGPQLPDIFGAFGDGLEKIFDAVKENPEYVGDLLYDLGQLTNVIGAVIAVAYDSYPAFHAMLSGLKNVADGLTIIKDNDVFGFLLTGLGGLIGKMDDMETGSGVAGVFASLNEGLLNAADGSGKLTDSQGALVDIMKTAGLTADELKAKLDRLTSTVLSEGEAVSAFEASIDAMTASLKKNGSAHGYADEKGRANEAGLRNIAKTAQAAVIAIRKNNGTIEEQAAAFQKARDAIVKGRIAMGDSDKAAKRFATTLLGVPGSKEMKLIGNIVDLKSKLDEAKRRLKTVPASQRSKLLGDIADLQAKIRRARAEIAAVQGKTVTVRVKVDRIGGIGQLTPQEKAGNADGNVWVPQAFGSVRAFAEGAENHVAQIARPGEYRLWAEDETGGEAYIPLAQSKRARSLAILEDVARRFGMMVARPMDSGGTLVDTADRLRENKVTSTATKGKSGGSSAIDSSVKAMAEKAKAAAAQKKLFAEIEAAGKKLISGITKAMMSSLDKVNAFSEKLNEMIKKYLSGARETAMLKWAGQIEAKMRSAATQFEAITATIKEAKEFAATTKNTLVGGAGIGGLGAIGNAQDVKGGLQFRAGEMQRFADQLGQLAQLGLNKDTILEIVGYGPQQGGALADILLKDTGTFAAINSAQESIEVAAGKIGDTAADAMYDTGAKAADGFLTGLYAKQAELSALMSTLGAELAAGIKSVVAQAEALAKTAKPKLVEQKTTSKPKLVENKKTSKPKLAESKTTKTVKKKAVGGIVEAGDWALVGEQGPELVNFGARGNVIPAPQTAGMLGGNTFNNSFNISVDGTFDFADADTRRQIAKKLAVEIDEELRVLARSKR